MLTIAGIIAGFVAGFYTAVRLTQYFVKAVIKWVKLIFEKILGRYRKGVSTVKRAWNGRYNTTFYSNRPDGNVDVVRQDNTVTSDMVPDHIKDALNYQDEVIVQHH